jgi:uncharacterized protein (DUF302 family)
MQIHGRHIVIDADFDRVLVDILQAFHDEGMEVVARVDVREHFRRTLGRDFRRHLLFEVWSPDLALNAMRQDLEVGTFVMTRFVVYELADGETVVAATEGLSPLLTDPTYRSEHPGLAALADRERERAAHVLVRLQHREATTAASSAA